VIQRGAEVAALDGLDLFGASFAPIVQSVPIEVLSRLSGRLISFQAIDC
jgi:hypothetical protein